MASLEKLQKALESLRNLHTSSGADESGVRAKEKMLLVAGSLCSTDAQSAHNINSLISYAMEMLLHLCNDNDANIRMIADESLNRVIRSSMVSNVNKVHLELIKEIEKNGNPRSLRAALWRFAALAHLIKPVKGKQYTTKLVSCIINIAKRSEESVLETLAQCIPKMFAALGCFLSDSDVKNLLHVFVNNIHSENAVLRRTAANSILGICVHCNKTQLFLSYTLNSLLDCVLPVKENESTYTILGVLNCIRGLLSHLDTGAKEIVLKGSFGVKRKDERESFISNDAVIQVFELCLHWMHNPDHNIVTTALETLNELLTSPPPQVMTLLLSSNGLSRSRIHAISIPKMSARCLSELSVSMTLPAVEDLSLLELDDKPPLINPSNWLPGLHQSLPPAASTIGSVSSISDIILDEPDSESVIGDESSLFSNLPIAPNSPEPPDLPPRDSPSPPPISHEFSVNWDIGELTDPNQCALLYCGRKLVSLFLIPEFENVRVSVRALALSCLSQVFRFYPRAFSMPLGRSGLSTPQGFSHMSDVLQFSTHSDQQLRGFTRILIGRFLQAKLKTSYGELNDSSPLYDSGILSKNVFLSDLLKLLEEGLSDGSSVCVRHTLSSLSVCLPGLMESDCHHLCLPILEKLLCLSENPYWLVKVKLVELLCSLSYLCVYFLSGSIDYQSRMLNCVILKLLASEDGRIRKATSENIANLVNNLYHPIDYGQDDAITGRASCLSISNFQFTSLEGTQFLTEKSKEEIHRGIVRESVLSRLVKLMTETLLQSSSKNLAYGCIEALCVLSVEFPPSTYPAGWECYLQDKDPLRTSSSACGLLSTCITLMTDSQLSYDLEAHTSLLRLTGNIFTGVAVCSSSQRSSQFENVNVTWRLFPDTKLASTAENLLIHLIRLLAIFVKVIEGNSKAPGASPLKKKPSRATSPSKVTSTPEKKTNLKEEKERLIGNFSHIQHYVKLSEIIKAGYNNYKVTLDSGASEKFIGLINHTLGCLVQLLGYASVVEATRIAEELLKYLNVIFILDSTTTMKAVIQLLRSFFEFTFCKETEGSEKSLKNFNLKPPKTGFFNNVIDVPLEKLKAHLDEHRKNIDKSSKEMEEPPTYQPPSPYDSQSLVSRIKLFEPIVVHALSEYTFVNNVKFQSQVLCLLTHLLKLKLNYCSLDVDQVFIQFVQRQFEFLERGQTRDAELLIPQIFYFFVHLSNNKNHTKPILSIPKIIQLCDGLMASGQNPVTHCIPALIPVVEHVFLMNTPITSDLKELETQREVLLVMLLRLAEYPEMLRLLHTIMKEGWRWEEHWKRWYRLTVEAILPLIYDGRLQTNDFLSLHSLLSLNPTFMAPLERVLMVLFTPKQDGQSIDHWLGGVIGMLLSISMYPEERVLLQLEGMNLYLREEGDDPLKVNSVSKTLPPQSLLAKLLLRVIMTVLVKLENLIKSELNSEDLSVFGDLVDNLLMCCIHMIQPKNFEEVGRSMGEFLQGNPEFTVIELIIVQISSICPLTCILWAYIMMILNQGKESFWFTLMNSQAHSISQKKGSPLPSPSLNVEVVQRGALIFYCEYLASNLDNLRAFEKFLDEHIESLIWNCQEPPVLKLLNKTYGLSKNSQLLLLSVSKCLPKCQPLFAHRILLTLQKIHPDHTGSVLREVALSLVEHKNVALARLAGAFCWRALEYLLTLEKSAVVQQISKEELLHLIESLTLSQKQTKRHTGLLSLLNKLGSQYYDFPPCELEHVKCVNPQSIRSITLDKDWLIAQIKEQCYNCSEADGKKCAQLLSKLDESDIRLVMSSEKFNPYILQHCFSLGVQMTQQFCAKGGHDKYLENLTPLFTCAQTVLIERLNSLSASLNQEEGNVALAIGSDSPFRLERVAESVGRLLSLVSAVMSYLSSFPELIRCFSKVNTLLPERDMNSFVLFGVICIEVIRCTTLQNGQEEIVQWPSLLKSFLSCSVSIFHLNAFTSLLTIKQLAYICDTIFILHLRLTGEEIRKSEFNFERDKPLTQEAQQLISVSTQMSSLMTWIEKTSTDNSKMSQGVFENIRSLVVSLGKHHKINWFSRIPVDGWTSPFDADCPPAVPISLLHDSEVLSQIIFRMSLLGWTGRVQFEETWMCLLGALSMNSVGELTDQEEINAIMQANSIAVDGMTWLVLSTLACASDSPSSPLLHIPRHNNMKIHTLNCWDRIVEMNDIMYWKLKAINNGQGIEITQIDKRPNLERINEPCRYSFGQLSIDFLIAQSKVKNDVYIDVDTLELCKKREKWLSEAGIDVTSCIQFLVDLYTQWSLPNSGVSLNVQLSMVKSVLCLSDMFTERNHFTWMLETFLSIARTHSAHDEILPQYLVIGIAKASAVLKTFEGEINEKIVKTLDHALKCPLMKSAGIHGLLYLLQSLHAIKSPEPGIEVSKLSPQEFKQKILQMALDYIQRHFCDEKFRLIDDQLLVLSLVSYTLEHYLSEFTNFPVIFKELTTLVKTTENRKIYLAVIQVLERLVLLGESDVSEQITRLALDRLNQSDPSLTLPALQLLISCIYADKSRKEELNVDKTTWTMDIMEKTTCLFDRIKKGYPIEVEVVCEILPGILSDFFSSPDILTKVIGEFLSPNQPHKHNMAAMVFQVFSQACCEQQLSLLQDWVVHSLGNFTNNLPLVMATWSLCCFFISASTNPWLRALFPHVQSRIQQCDYEDKKILCVSALDFYQHLSKAQQEMFLQSFKESKEPHLKSPFSDIIACL